MGTVNFFNGTAQVGSGPVNNGAATFSYNPSALAVGTYSMTAAYRQNGNFATSTSAAQILSVQDFQITLPTNPTTVTVTAPGQKGTTTLTITPLGGFNQTINYSCSGLPSEATCTFSSSSATTETVTVQTMAPSAWLNEGPFGRRRGLFYALLLPGFLGLLVTAGNRKRTLRGGRLLGLIAVLAISTLWMPACGGGSTSRVQGNPGTPTGSSTVTIKGNAGTLIHSVQITLAVK
jgi:hypothetical protein